MKNLNEMSQEHIENMTFFLRYNHGIPLKSLDPILGGDQEYHKRILTQYLAHFNFKNSDLLPSIRVLLSSFLMSGGRCTTTKKKKNHLHLSINKET